jgi:hypothetical protein
MSQQRDNIFGLQNLFALAAFMAGSLIAFVVALYWTDGEPARAGALGGIGMLPIHWLGSIPTFALAAAAALLGAASFLRLADVPLARVLHAAAWSALALSWVMAGAAQGAGGRVGVVLAELLPGWWGRGAAVALGVSLFVASIYVLWLPLLTRSAQISGDPPDLQAVVKGKSLAEGVSTAEASALLPHAGAIPAATAAGVVPAASGGSPREADPRLQGRVPPGAKPLEVATPSGEPRPAAIPDDVHREADTQSPRPLQAATERHAAPAAAGAAEPAGADLGWRRGAPLGGAADLAARATERSAAEQPEAQAGQLGAAELGVGAALPVGARPVAPAAVVAAAVPAWELRAVEPQPAAEIASADSSAALDAAAGRKIPSDSWSGTVWEARAEPERGMDDRSDASVAAGDDAPGAEVAPYALGASGHPDVPDDASTDEAELGTARAPALEEYAGTDDVGASEPEHRPAAREVVQQSLFEERDPSAHEPEPETRREPAPDVAEDLPLVTLTPARPRELSQRQRLVFDAGCLFLAEKRVAVSMLQRNFALDFDQATEILDELQSLGLLGPYLGGTRRDILLTREQWLAKHGQSA